MTKKRFNVFDVDGTIFLEDHKEGSYHIGEIENVDLDCLNDIADRLNELHEENQELKQELHKIYEIATVNKVRDIVENVYDDLLYETSDESDYARKKVLKCLEDIDNLRDDVE